jgi:hypothetical protein
MRRISISICPTELEFTDGSRYDEQTLLDAIREFVTRRHPDATITTLQVGYRQGDAWARVDGDDEAGGELLAAFFEEHGTNEELFVQPQPPVIVEFAVADETIRECGQLYQFAGVEHPYMADACAAYRAAATTALADDPRGGRLVVESPRGQRILHSAWAGAHWSYSVGAIGTMGDLADDEKAAVSAADDAGREAARRVIEEADSVA